MQRKETENSTGPGTEGIQGSNSGKRGKKTQFPRRKEKGVRTSSGPGVEKLS